MFKTKQNIYMYEQILNSMQWQSTNHKNEKKIIDEKRDTSKEVQCI